MSVASDTILKKLRKNLNELLTGQIPEIIEYEGNEAAEEKALIDAVNCLVQCFAEIQAFIVPLSQGELGRLSVCRQNLLASPFKELHSRLRNLTWQAECVAKGDYHQRVDFMGDFSKAFNTMVQELEKRENEIIEARDRLKEKVDEQTRDLILTNNKLQVSLEQVRTANKDLKNMQAQIIQNEKLASIGQLAAGVAHEMNTPVGFVTSNFQSLKKYIEKFMHLFAMYESLADKVENGTRDERLKLVENINQAREDLKIDFVLDDLDALFDESSQGLERVTEIVQNLRDFSRIDQVESVTDYDLNAGVRATLTVARNEIKYEAEVVTDLNPNLPAVKCNSGQINQVLLNIIVNAAQAIASLKREEKGVIFIRTYSTDKEVICEIRDNGPGIPDKILDKIFDPFFTTKPVGKGTGLGLNVSYDIITNKHKGRLLADSTVGEGTTFMICLPVKDGKNDYKESQDSISDL